MDRDAVFDLQRHQPNSPTVEPTLTASDLEGAGRVNDRLYINGDEHLQDGVPERPYNRVPERPFHGVPERPYHAVHERLHNGSMDEDDIRGAPSMDSMSISKRSATSGSGSLSKFADFFGAEIFQIVLHNPSTAHQLLKFSQSRFCGENMEFLEKVCPHNHLE
jgi:hypothetical protein